MLKKTSADAKTRVGFSIVFSSFFREKSSKNHAKQVKIILVHKNHQKITRGTLLFSKKTVFSQFLGSPWVPRGLPGRPSEIPKIAHFSHSWSIATENDGGRPPGGLGRAPEVPPGAPRV